MARFREYFGLDYSGAATADTPLPGLRLYRRGLSLTPSEVSPSDHGRRHWTRRQVADWLIQRLLDSSPALIGIDHAFSFPLPFFHRYGLPLNWEVFLEDFARHYPCDKPGVTVEEMRLANSTSGVGRFGDSKWRRATERRAGGAKSVFHFDVPGSVAKSTHAGLPWLLQMRRTLGTRLHFWPFDGWNPPAGSHVIAEIYPSLWNDLYPRADRSADQHDAFSACQWLAEADRQGRLEIFLQPNLLEEDQWVANVEGWILGCLESPVKSKSSRDAASPLATQTRTSRAVVRHALTPQ